MSQSGEANPLRTYIDSFPRNEREAVRERLQKAGGVEEAGLRHWANGIRSVPGPKVIAVCKATEGVVLPHELRPDIFPVPPTPKRGRGATGAARDSV